MSQTTNVVRARNELGRLFSNGKTPTAAEELAARQSLAAAKLDRDLRQAATTVQPMLTDGQAGHLVGLLLGECGVSAESIGWLETAVREAVRNAQAGAE